MASSGLIAPAEAGLAARAETGRLCLNADCGMLDCGQVVLTISSISSQASAFPPASVLPATLLVASTIESVLGFPDLHPRTKPRERMAGKMPPKEKL